MSYLDVLWRRYGLRENPYFVNALSIKGEVPLSLFIGREKEQQELNNIIRTGEARCIVVGAPGVGKTTLVKSIRSLGESDYSLLETMALMFVFLVSLSLLFIWTFGAARKNEKSKH